MKFVFSYLFILFYFPAFAIAQCIDKPKVEAGGDYGFVAYMFNCPSYTFAYGGDTSKNWNTLNNHIDIRQAPKKVLVYKKMIEKKIESYSGHKFSSYMRFYDVDVNYPAQIQRFKDSGRMDMNHKYSKAKYFYYYRFGPNDTAVYLIGIAVNKNGKIISPFTFPSKRYYKPIDETFTYCKLIDIARRVQKNIDPIDNIKLDYDRNKKSFFWQITQSLGDTHEGTNYFNQVIIDAGDISKAKAIVGHVRVIH